MARQGKLANIIIGVMIDPDNQVARGVKRVAQTLQKSGRRLALMGMELTRSVTLPIAAIGVAAIKSAADFDALEKALGSIMGGAEAAQIEMQKLRDLAMKPGLGFEQAIRGSLRLQSLGVSAEGARTMLDQLGKATALSGKGPESMDAALLQFTQMLGKGRILSEDFRRIQDQLPLITDAMQKAFGKRNIEDIRAMGISAGEFVGGITAELYKLEEVPGSLKNSIQNAFMVTKQVMGEFGMAINKSLNIDKVLGKGISLLKGLTEKFKGLTPEMQQSIIKWTLLIAAIGPALKLLGSVQILFASIGSAMKVLITPIGLLVSGLIALTVAWNAAVDSMNQAAEHRPDTLLGKWSNFWKQQGIIAERSRKQISGGWLNGKYADFNKEGFLIGPGSDMFDVSAEDMAGYKLEKLDPFKKMKEMMDKYIPDISGGFKVTEDHIKNLQDELKKFTNQSTADLEKVVEEVMTFKKASEEAADAWKVAEARYGMTGDGLTFLESQLKAVEENIDNLSKAVAEGNASPLMAWLSGLVQLAEALKQRIEDVKNGLAEIGLQPVQSRNETYRRDPQADASDTVKRMRMNIMANASDDEGLGDTVDSIIARSRAGVAALGETIQAILAVKKEFNLSAKEISEHFGNLGDEANEYAGRMEEISERVGEALGDLAANMLEFALSDSIEILFDKTISGAEKTKQMILKLIGIFQVFAKALISASIAAMALQEGGILANPGAVLAAGVALLALTTIAKSALSKSTSLAEGGIVEKPTLAVVGDNPRSPEVVAPLHKLEKMIGGRSSEQKVEVVGRFDVRGEDLILVLDTAQQRMIRSRGY